MDIIIITVLVLLAISFAALVFFINKKFKDLGEGQKDDKSILMLNQNIQGVQQALREQSNTNTKIIQQVTQKLGELDNTNKQVMNFADQLQRLQDILKNPKQRGVFGEYYLETLLKNAFQPNQYQMQYKFKDGEIVDAALFFGDKVIPIDSKFSLENYNRIVEEHDPNVREGLEKAFKSDLKKRIDETSKYIRPEENTMEFAFMFIPAEGIYYDLLVNKVGAIKVNTRDLIDYAINEKKVHIVSPTTFYVTLQSMSQGQKAYKIQEQTKEIIKNVVQLQNHINSYESYLQKLGNNLSTTVNMYNSAYKEFKKIDKDVVKIAGGESKTEVLEVDKPQTEN